MVAVASQRKLEIDSGEMEMTRLHRKEYKASPLWPTRTGPQRTTGITMKLRVVLELRASNIRIEACSLR
jgi:hypothetical protein